jgi:predicted kinase
MASCCQNVAVVDQLVMVNGLPASGKTTLATGLAARLPAPLVSKDAIKEAIAGVVAAAPRSAVGGIAMEAAWRLLAAMPGTVVLESWWFKPRDLDFVTAALDRLLPAVVVEVWCDVPADVARDRYEKRRRHSVHDDARRLADSWEEWAAQAEPLGLGKTLRVSTDGPVETDALAREILLLTGSRVA